MGGAGITTITLIIIITILITPQYLLLFLLFKVQNTSSHKNTKIIIDRWLNHEESIGEEAGGEGVHLHFKVKYWKHPKDIQDPVALALFYYQV